MASSCTALLLALLVVTLSSSSSSSSSSNNRDCEIFRDRHFMSDVLAAHTIRETRWHELMRRAHTEDLLDKAFTR
jgi:hypothetical protein